MRAGAIISVSALALTVLAGCERGGGGIKTDSRGRGTVTDEYPAASPRLPARESPLREQTEVRGNTDAGAAFANWVVSTDPEQRYILEAFVRDERVLGVTVSPTTTRAEVDDALRSLLTAMRKTFPGRPVEAIAYYESGDQLERLVWNAQRGEAEAQWRR
jgi:hypothetical protein